MSKKSQKRKKRQDDLCERCGRCCLLKELDRESGLLVALDVYCPHFTLDKEKGLCKIYGNHIGTPIVFKRIRGRCLSHDQMIKAKILPKDCPYVKNIPGYRTLVVNYEEAP